MCPRCGYYVGPQEWFFSFDHICPVASQGKKIEGALRLWRWWPILTPLEWCSWHSTNSPRLASTSAGYTWTKDAQRAHRVPRLGDHRSGFHGFSSFGAAVEMMMALGHNADGCWNAALGTFLGWGRTVRHRTGYRTEYAQPEAVLDFDSLLELHLAHHRAMDVSPSTETFERRMPRLLAEVVSNYGLQTIKAPPLFTWMRPDDPVVPFDELSIRVPDSVLHQELEGLRDGNTGDV